MNDIPTWEMMGVARMHAYMIRWSVVSLVERPIVTIETNLLERANGLGGHKWLNEMLLSSLTLPLCLFPLCLYEQH